MPITTMRELRDRIDQIEKSDPSLLDKPLVLCMQQPKTKTGRLRPDKFFAICALSSGLFKLKGQWSVLLNSREDAEVK